MIRPQHMPDLIVVIPGILGSVLVKDGREVWGPSPGSVIRTIATFGRSFDTIRLENGVGDEDPDDGITAPVVLPRLGLIPRFWKVDGYGKLRSELERRFTLTPATTAQAGNLLEFPYDWRLSNVVNAKRLSGEVEPCLKRWRIQTNNPDAKLILVCHSMGGLIARYFLEVLGGHELTRLLITLGTPYKGSVNALKALVNGVSIGLGPIGISLDDLIRSFPSIYQLLPTYRCVNVGDGATQRLVDVELPNIDGENVRAALAFHDRIASAIGGEPAYRTFAFKGIDQPTPHSATLKSGAFETSREYDGKPGDGDGTVPRGSAHPPEWSNDETLDARHFGQSHAMLQSGKTILDQIFGILSEGEPFRLLAEEGTLGLDLPDLVAESEGLEVNVTSTDGVRDLPLHVHCVDEHGNEHGSPVLMRPRGDGSYAASLDPLPVGAWCVAVQSATPARQVEPVSDWTLVWGRDSGST